MADLTYASLNNWLKFKHLVLLETLARTNNMHLAAEQMNLSQPAVSKMLKEIEMTVIIVTHRQQIIDRFSSKITIRNQELYLD